MSDVHESYVIEQPWIVLTYPVTDAQADADGGRSRVVLERCACGASRTVAFTLPLKDDRVWESCDPRKGLPEYYRHRLRFQEEHLHPDRQANPVLTWARPLRNL